MPIIYSYPIINTVNNADMFVISESPADPAVDEWETKSLTANNLASYVTARVNLNFLGDTGTGVVNLDTQNLTISGTSNEIETSASSQTLQIGLPDNVTITNLTVGGTLNVTGQSTLSSVNVTDLTSGRVVLVGTSGELQDDSDLTFTGSTLTATNLTVSTDLTVGNDVQVDNDVNVDGEVQTNTLAVTTTSTMQGSLSMTLNNINNVANPVSQQDAATKLYVDTVCSGLFNFRGSFRADTGEILTGINAGSYIYNCPGGAGTRVSLLTGDYYIVANSGGNFYCSGDLLNVGDSIMAVADAAADSSTVNDWATLESDNIEGTGTPNTIPLWTDSQVLGDSVLSQDAGATTLTVAGIINGQGAIEGESLTINTGPSTITGELDKDGNKITNLGDPTSAQDATTKTYVDSADAVNAANITTNTGNISTNTGNISSNTIAITGKLNKSGDTMTGVLNMGSNKITSLSNPTAAQDAATKAYVDASSGSGVGNIVGTANEIDVSVFGTTYTLSLPGQISTNVLGNLTGNVFGNITGNVTGNVAGGDLTGSRVIVRPPFTSPIAPIQNARLSVQSDASVGIGYNNINPGVATTAIAFENGGSPVGSIVVSGSSTAYNTSSDYRLKENVVEMTGAIERISKLEPKRFNFIANPELTLDGFLAHEVENIVPEAVDGVKDGMKDFEEIQLDENNEIIEEPIIVTKPKYQSIDQSKLVPLLVGAVQELIKEVNELKSRL